MRRSNEFIFAEKYRPKTIDEVITTPKIKKQFQDFLKQGDCPNLILVGPPGTGKTTIAMALLEELGVEWILIPGSIDGGIDTLRTRMAEFASGLSLTKPGARKFIILDEADHMTNAMLKGLRNFIQEYSANCGFILTGNDYPKLSEPLDSRAVTIHFNYSKLEKERLSGKFITVVENILAKENIKYDLKVVALVIQKYAPDWRKVLNELQGYGNPIDSGILGVRPEIDGLVKLMKAGNFSEIRQWIANFDGDYQGLFRIFYDEALEYFSPSFIPLLILILADYQDKASRVRDQQINLAAMFVQIMNDAQWK